MPHVIFYVADRSNKRVQVLAPDLTFKREIKCEERALGVHVAVDEGGDVHACSHRFRSIDVSRQNQLWQSCGV